MSHISFVDFFIEVTQIPVGDFFWSAFIVVLFFSKKTFPGRVLLAKVVTAFSRSLAKFGRHVQFSKFSPFD